MARNKGVVRPKTNAQILDAIRVSGTGEYQRRIPASTKGNISETVAALNKYSPQRNEFLDALINRIGSVIVRDISWSNPLATFKRGMLDFGDTIEEVQTDIIKSRTYSAQRDYLEGEIFGTHGIDVASQFHTVNRQEYYPVTVNDAQLRRAFLDEANGLSQLLTNIMNAAQTSDQYDEFLVTCSLFKEYDNNGGFFKVNVPDIVKQTSTEADSKAALRRIIACAGNMRFPSTTYNAAHLHSFANPEDLVLFTTPEFQAAVDVMALAAAFNADRMEMPGRTVLIPDGMFGIDGAQAVLTTNDFFVIADQRLENTSQYNPVSLGTNYFLHHWEVISCSRFAPAVLFTTGAGTQVSTYAVPALTLKAAVVKRNGETFDYATAKAIPGDVLEIIVEPTGAGYSEDMEVGIDYSITGNADARTRIDNEGVLIVGPGESNNVKVKAAVTQVNGNKKVGDPKTEFTIQVDASKVAKEWPAV